MVACFVFNALETAGTIVWATTKQRLVPRRLLGRVSSFDWFISIGLLPVSFALTGPVASAIGARATLIGAGVLGADRDARPSCSCPGCARSRSAPEHAPNASGHIRTASPI